MWHELKLFDLYAPFAKRSSVVRNFFFFSGHELKLYDIYASFAKRSSVGHKFFSSAVSASYLGLPCLAQFDFYIHPIPKNFSVSHFVSVCVCLPRPTVSGLQAGPRQTERREAEEGSRVKCAHCSLFYSANTLQPFALGQYKSNI